MEQQNVSPWKANLNWGLILGFVSIIYTAILYFADQIFNQTLGFLSILFTVILLFFGIKAYRDQYKGGFIKYGQAVGAGVIISLYASIISAIFTIILYKLIDPDLVNKLYAFSEQRMLDQGRPENQVEMAMEFTKIFLNPFVMAGMAIVNGVFFGLIISLIEAIFLKREGAPEPVAATEEEKE
jgi:hypothetical protein